MATRELERQEQVAVSGPWYWVAVNAAPHVRTLDMSTGDSPVLPLRMTYEEFLAWADEDRLAEWVAVPGANVGVVMMTSPASMRHQDVSGFLESILRSFVETYDLGVVLSAPFQMKLPGSGREPDLLFVATEHLERLKTTYLDGPADLVVEIVSPESVGRDRGEKFYEYERGGVSEYWLVDPLRRRFEAYHLDEQGFYCTLFSGAGGRYDSQVLTGFWLRVEWLWQEPLPVVEDVLLEVGGEAYAQRWVVRLRERGFLS